MFTNIRRIALGGLAALLIGMFVVPEADARPGVGGGWGGYRNYGGVGYGRGYYGGVGYGGYGYPYGSGFGIGIGRGYYGGLGYGGYGSTYGAPYYGYGGSYNYPSYYYGSPTYTAPSTMVVPSTTTYQSLYPATTAVAGNSASIDVRVPPNARVWFDNQEMAQNVGTMRHFSSPPLEPGSDYQYTVRAQWMQNGQMIQNVKNVIIHAGDRVTVDFLSGT